MSFSSSASGNHKYHQSVLCLEIDMVLWWEVNIVYIVASFNRPKTQKKKSKTNLKIEDGDADITRKPSGDQANIVFPPPPIRRKGTAVSIETFHTL